MFGLIHNDILGRGGVLDDFLASGASSFGYRASVAKYMVVCTYLGIMQSPLGFCLPRYRYLKA